MGFEDYPVERARPLADGTPMDRMFKRYVLNPVDLSAVGNQGAME